MMIRGDSGYGPALPELHKRLRWLEFVPELPKTATGKIQRFRLRVSGAPSAPAAES